MPNLNKHIIIGHLGNDVELRYTGSGKAVASVNVATSYGKKEDRKTEWHKVVAWEEKAELLAENFSKGSAIHIEGISRTRAWEDTQGVKRYTTEVIADYIGIPLYKKRDQAASEPAESGQQTNAGPVSDRPTDDIPF